MKNTPQKRREQLQAIRTQSERPRACRQLQLSLDDESTSDIQETDPINEFHQSHLHSDTTDISHDMTHEDQHENLSEQTSMHVEHENSPQNQLQQMTSEHESDEAQHEEENDNTAMELWIQESLKLGMNLGRLRDVDEFDGSTFPRYPPLPNLMRPEHLCSECGAYTWKGEKQKSNGKHKGITTVRAERPGFCCEKGKVKLEPLPEIPPEFVDLFKGNSPNCRKFLENARRYNNLFSLASLGIRHHSTQSDSGSQSDRVRPSGWNPTYNIQGMAYHRIGSLLPTNDSAKFAQIYFIDNELDRRLQLSSELTQKYDLHPLDDQVVKLLQDVIHRENPYIKEFKSALAFTSDVPPTHLKFSLRSERQPAGGEHRGTYNLPQAQEIAVLSIDEEADQRDIVIQTVDGAFSKMKPNHRSYDSFHYILLFPHGTDGYKPDIPHCNKRGNVSENEFYRYRLQVRREPGEDYGLTGEQLLKLPDPDPSRNIIMRSRRLMQQYFCDQFSKIENFRLHWVRDHQKTIKAECYKVKFS